jgi:hypothetical protein
MHNIASKSGIYMHAIDLFGQRTEQTGLAGVQTGLAGVQEADHPTRYDCIRQCMLPQALRCASERGSAGQVSMQLVAVIPAIVAWVVAHWLAQPKPFLVWSKITRSTNCAATFDTSHCPISEDGDCCHLQIQKFGLFLFVAIAVENIVGAYGAVRCASISFFRTGENSEGVKAASNDLGVPAAHMTALFLPSGRASASTKYEECTKRKHQ